MWQASNVDLGIFDAFRLHASAAAPNCTFGSDLCGNFAHEHSLLKEPLVQDGYAIVPTGPGLGVELDEEAVARYALRNHRGTDGFAPVQGDKCSLHEGAAGSLSAG